MKPPKLVRQIVVGVVGGTVLVVGVAMIVLPGPAILIVPAGLAILATEFAWAAVWLEKSKAMFRRTAKSPAPSPTPPTMEKAAKPEV